MKIETRFNIGDLINPKYQREFDINTHKDNSIICMEILDIYTDTNSIGTEVHYSCSPIYIMFDSNFKAGKIERTISDFCPGDKNIKIREDEIRPASKTVIDLLKSEPAKIAE